jgi:hypothetical protein
LALALANARKAARLRSFEVRAELPAGDGVHLRSDAFTHTTALSGDKDAVFASFHPSQVQRNIRRAKKEQVVVRSAEEMADLTRVFYRLHVQTRRRLGMPVQPRRFFEAIWRHLFVPGYGRLQLAYSGTRPIAGAVFLTGNNVLTYKYGASDPAFWNLRPNHLVFWTALQWASETGFTEFDWGRSDAADKSLREFKSYWAGNEKPLVYSTLANGTPKEESPRAMNIGRTVLRRSPTWVCRAAGELFYRYAA